ncbi:MAG: four helix bundle protein [Planctomycetes bacterium]|nr:four helix bundle protein [Planctomycetota bacterium]
MTASPFTRPPAREAGPELLCLQKWEETAGWLIESTAKWPKSARFGLVQKVDNHALDIVEMLVVARYEPGSRRKLLRVINLRLERLRFLLRIARTRNVMPADKFETAMRGVDELGRMLHGWRVAIGERTASGERLVGSESVVSGDAVEASFAAMEVGT